MFNESKKVINEQRQGERYLPNEEKDSSNKFAFVETYGCQMNFSDTEIIASVLTDAGYGFTQDELNADLVLLNTCSIRENAENRVWQRLKSLSYLKKKKPGLVVGLLGCMAERLKDKVLEQEKLVDLVVGPDAYRSLPTLLAEIETGQKAVNVLLSREETYADISPVRLNSNGVTAFLSIMRGCNNMCSFCVVPFTRGRERSRPAKSILDEVSELIQNGYKEVTLLGQNVDSYDYEGVSFAQIMRQVAALDSSLRVRFATSHPKDITDEVLFTIAEFPNICNYIHLPVQSGSTRILDMMNRNYSREWYLQKIARIREIIPNCAISTDIITGFCSETESDHQETVSLMKQVQFDYAYMFAYSERDGTLAQRKYPDDVPEETKKQRLNEIIDIQSKASFQSNQRDIGKKFSILVEKTAKKNQSEWCGRNDNNKMVVFSPKNQIINQGDYVEVLVESATSATLLGSIAE